MANENPYSSFQASSQLREAYKAMRKLAIMRVQTEEFYVAFDQLALRLGNVVLELKEEVRAELAELVKGEEKKSNLKNFPPGPLTLQAHLLR